MPYFKVILNGEGIRVLSDGPEVSGFYTTRRVSAPDEATAISIARRLVKDEWSSGEYASLNRGRPPILRIEAVLTQSWLGKLVDRNKYAGYTFYSEETEDAAPD